MTCFWRGLHQTKCEEPAPINVVSDGFVGAGLNDFGQLGLGHTNPVHTFANIPLANVSKFSVGYKFSVALTSDGKVWGSGLNDANQYGSDLPSSTSTFTEITPILGSATAPIIGSATAPTFVDVACGHRGFIAVASDGRVFGCGRVRTPRESVQYAGSFYNEPLDLPRLIETGAPVKVLTTTYTYSTGWYQPILDLRASANMIMPNRTSMQGGVIQRYRTFRSPIGSVSVANAQGTIAEDDAYAVFLNTLPDYPSYFATEVNDFAAPQFAYHPDSSGSSPNNEWHGGFWRYGYIRKSFHYTTTHTFHSLYSGMGDSLIIRTTAGDLYGIGVNKFGEFGLGNTTSIADTIADILSSSSGSIQLSLMNQLAAGVVDVRVGRFQNFYKKNTGEWWTAGRNAYGSMGLGHTTDQHTLVPVGVFDDLQTSICDTLALESEAALLVPPNFPEEQLLHYSNEYQGD